MSKEYISPITYENGELVINANCTQANDSLICATKLQEKINEGYEETVGELQEMEDTMMVWFSKKEIK